MELEKTEELNGQFMDVFTVLDTPNIYVVAQKLNSPKF